MANLRIGRVLVLLVALFAVSCAPEIPRGHSETRHVREGEVDVFLELVTHENEAALRAHAGSAFERYGWDWRAWESWRFVADGAGPFSGGDRLWYFGTDPESWRNSAGRAGFRVMRGDVVVAEFVSVMN